MKRNIFYLSIALMCVIVTDDVCARKRVKEPIYPEWKTMSRGEHIAYLSLTPRSKPAVREYMCREIERMNEIAPLNTMRDSLIVSVELPVARFFGVNDTLLSKEGVKLLGKLIPITRRNDYRMLVSVHTADAGSTEYLSRVSQLRADAIAQSISENTENIPIVIAYGVAGNEPVSPNTTYIGRMNNRRVEILLIPSDDLIMRLTTKK